MRTQKVVVLNSITSLLYQLITVLYGFIIPRLIISHYGSDMNGWLTSIIKFLSLISVCEFGIGSVIKANLYKPLYDNNREQIAKIIKSANKFFYRIGMIFLAYTVALVFLFPLLQSNTFGFRDTTLMIIVVSLGTFSQYFFGMSSQLLLEADQKGYINYIIGICSTVIIIIASFLLIDNGFSLLAVRIVYAIVFCIRPLCLFAYSKKLYHVQTKDVTLTEEPIKQKWNGFSLHVAQIVQNNTDTMVLTAFSAISNVSIYSVYHLVTNGLSVIINILGTSMTPVFGRIIASDDYASLRSIFSRFEWLMHCAISCIFAVCGIGIVPFISIYTRGVSDANYIRPDFGILMTIATALYCLTQLYLTLINSAGKFKETERYIILEPIINIIISVIAVKRFGLVGVTVGTIISMLYKLIFLDIYLSRHIIKKKLSGNIKLYILDALIIGLTVLISRVVAIGMNDYFNWGIHMLIIFLISIVIGIALNLIMYRSELKWLIKQLLAVKFKH